MRPRRGLLALGFVLMVINKVAGFVLPYSSKFLIDNVVSKHQVGLLRPLVFAVLLATLIQGVTSFSLTQLLSKAAQRLIADLRQQVQAHISRLPVSFYDANKTGALVSRIMSDVEGVRNLLGTGLVDFAGGLVAAGIALALLDSHQRPADADRRRFARLFCLCSEPRLCDDPSHFSRAWQDQRRGHRTPDGISWRSSRDQGISRGRTRRENFCRWSPPPSRQRHAYLDGYIADGTLCQRAAGRRRRRHHVYRWPSDDGPHSQPRKLFLLQLSLGFPDRPGDASRLDRHAAHRGTGRFGANAGNHARTSGGSGSEPLRPTSRHCGHGRIRERHIQLRRDSRCSARHFFSL